MASPTFGSLALSRLESVRLRAWPTRLAYGAFGLAALLTFGAALAVFGGHTRTEDAIRGWMWVLGANGLIIIVLCALVGVRIWRLVRARVKNAAAMRLHLRFTGFMTVAALLPAGVVAVFLGVMVLGLFDTWFSDRVGGVVENAAGVARDYVDDRVRQVGERVELMAIDLNRPEAAAALPTERVTYSEYLRVQTSLRGFEAAYIVDRAGVVLAFAEPQNQPAYLVPSSEDFIAVDQGQFPIRYGGMNDPRIRALMRLDAYEDAYLYVTQRIPEDITSKLSAAQQAFLDYSAARQEHGRLQQFIGVIYVQMTLLVAAGAASLGMGGATRLVAPIGRLVRAAERVGGGDLAARVHLDSQRDEIALLARTFNEMTEQLATQRDQLISARETAEARRELTEAVLGGVSAGVIAVNRHDMLTLANASAVDLLGADSAEALVGRPIGAVAPELAPLCARAKQSDAPAEAQTQIERQGRVRHLSVRAGGAGDGSGAVVITFDDITRLVSAQRNAAWRDVARRIAHEIRNPLTPIQLSAERLQRKYRPDDDNRAEVFDRCTDTILNKVGDIGRMVDEFSSFARMPAPRIAPVGLLALVRDAVFAQRVATPAIEFAFEPPESDVIAACDERLFAQALANVLKNAAESVSARMSHDPGGREDAGAVRVRLQPQTASALVEVRDNGLGWPTTDLDRLQEPYFTTREKGTGLGLAIVKRVMEDHGGRLQLAEPADGTRGAVVRLVLPLDATEHADAPLSQDATQAPPPRALISAHGES